MATSYDAYGAFSLRDPSTPCLHAEAKGAVSQRDHSIPCLRAAAHGALSQRDSSMPTMRLAAANDAHSQRGVPMPFESFASSAHAPRCLAEPLQRQLTHPMAMRRELQTNRYSVPVAEAEKVLDRICKDRVGERQTSRRQSTSTLLHCHLPYLLLPLLLRPSGRSPYLTIFHSLRQGSSNP